MVSQGENGENPGLLDFARRVGYNYSMVKTVWAGLAAAIFLVFLACDEPMEGYYTINKEPSGDEMLIYGFVYASEPLLDKDEKPVLNDDDEPILVEKPIPGIVIYVKDVIASLTDAKGNFSFILPIQPKKDAYDIQFIDLDSDRKGGQYEPKSENPKKTDIGKSSPDKPLKFKLTLSP